MRAALARLAVALRDAETAVDACERERDAQHRTWLDALTQGGVYGPREAAGASHSVEQERVSLNEAKARHLRALEHARQARAHWLEQQQRLRDNARKQEKLRELLTCYRA
ncbi:hypothetical protein PAN31108_04562 [Pandoraea anhela]|uniref:Flagellar FliJ protein n=2 Tax=Pandoraea anhela TaxID=2508295 RepID=A0A5E4YK51_9BURK|nr:hypothetical protein PAN31108_04562 [Pandoraea anhela]